MAHTLSTLKVHSNKSIAFYAARIWDLSVRGGRPLFIEARNVCHSADAMLALGHCDDRAAWQALRAYARRALLPATNKIGAIVVNGAACFAPQNGDRLTIDVNAIGCSRSCGNGAFSA